MERTLFLIKPDAVSKKIAGKIIDILEKNDLHIAEMKMLRLDTETAEKFYKEHKNKKFYHKLIKYVTSGPIIAMVLEGEDAIKRARKIIGSTDPKKAEPGTIRNLFGTDRTYNAVHASDSPESAEYEINIIFNNNENN
ncbi:MAG TPA: nucleoside-diphosphate kinase [Candidatus Desulfofervidus auxilii]|uniref:Nucleoside diphosphate kinase n=1 Tax=Desulfofervidus auxilii TaxID=1621989 RepID=A0A7C0U2K4_DESA2|nr:nucleoside-diphosphate kinase [Candidatus Desulfofervidus auxilii]